MGIIGGWGVEILPVSKTGKSFWASGLTGGGWALSS
jgi:hypothetical protein